MSASRAESQYSRRRSNTAQSIFKNPPPPLEYGASKVLTAWVHDAYNYPNVLLNHSHLPGVAAGDLMRLTFATLDDKTGFLFVVPNEDSGTKPLLQISLPKPVSEAFGIRNNAEVTVTKVENIKCQADYVEFIFQDQYLGRNDMWRLSEQLAGQCLHIGQEVSFIGSVAAKVDAIYVHGEKVSSGYVTATTKAIYRSLSAKVTIFIQVCRELWEFAGDGERYNEKIVHSFLPELMAKWRLAGTNHTVTIVLISRVFYDRTEVDYAEGPLRQDEDGRWYKDFYKVITDLEVIYGWQSTFVSLKDSFWAFQRDILLTHHYHRTWQASGASMAPPEEVRLVGQLSFAHDGPLLEALNMALNPSETHYIDRSLSLTGSLTIVITPGTGYYRVSKQLLRLTTTRMLDLGFGVDLVSLANPPLHRSPIFSFKGIEPELLKHEKVSRYGSRAMDPLWGGDDGPADCLHREKKTFWWEPFWIGVSFWDRQMDLPLRHDRFVARAKMHEIQMLGLLDHDVLSSIEVPNLPEHYDSLLCPLQENDYEKYVAAKKEADQFDTDIFEFKAEHKDVKINLARAPSGSSAVSVGGTPTPSSLRAMDKRPATLQRNSHSKIPPIEESPRVPEKELPEESTDYKRLSAAAISLASVSGLSSSPSQSSIRSARSNVSASSTGRTKDRRKGSSNTLLPTKFSSSWIFNPFRSTPSQPETSPISASGESSPISEPRRRSRTPPSVSPSRSIGITRTTRQSNAEIARSPLSSDTGGVARSPRVAITDVARSRSPQPVPIKKHVSSRRSKMYEETSTPLHGSLPKHIQTPLNTPPREDSAFDKRRNTLTSTYPYGSASSPSVRPNPSSPQTSVSYSQASLARRWQHMFPQPVYKHDIKWKSMVTPGCLPLTTEEFPTTSELETAYDVFSYDFIVDPPETRSFLVRPPNIQSNNPDEVRRAWALVVMRGMIALRLAQGFQFVLRPAQAPEPDPRALRRSKSYLSDDDVTPRPGGAAEALRQQADPVYLSMSNEIHRISYTGEAIQVRRYVRRMPPSDPFEYKCLIWPKLGVGYTELSTSFTSHGLENYGWNRLDMLVAGYEHQFNESLRYWRTRFIVIPSAETPQHGSMVSDKLNEEEIQILGIEKLTEMFARLRWVPPDERGAGPPQPVRLLVTDVGPSAMMLDDHLMARLDEIHAAGPLRKKVANDRYIADMSLAAIAKAMREADGVPIKEHRWHLQKYPDSFLGYEFVNWLCREFQDVSTRDQATEWGVKLQEQGLFEHCRGRHGFFDGHYFYQLKGEYAVVSTPRTGWPFRSRPSHEESMQTRGGFYPSNGPKQIVKKPRKRVILSERMVIDVDPNKKSNQAECVVLHHDIVHNPATIFHFELHWIGTAARCIEDILRTWNRTIERYGLTLVEAYVTQIGDIAQRNPFQSCFPVRLAVPPPYLAHLAGSLPEGTPAANYFEYALLRRFDFVLDIEAANLYPAHVDAQYSYRRAPFAHSQWVHRSGVAFVQVLGGAQGFLFLTNRLMGPGRMNTSPVGVARGKEQRPAVAAEGLRVKLEAFCADKDALTRFYDDELPRLPDEPPPLSI
ncbi:hypothetical protein FA95DRAFT_1600463 [Auriscalpium vulgare]|uniref:Uncharacterized protein n=1 Tax=Auriscalpium vulgare TaxID=40419 RepID=A0ACB8SBH1_9AGAM|nr:hypothetical protein FA95DRAFT_1600463 [Auriscalpium vulgare]